MKSPRSVTGNESTIIRGLQWTVSTLVPHFHLKIKNFFPGKVLLEIVLLVNEKKIIEITELFLFDNFLLQNL